MGLSQPEDIADYGHIRPVYEARGRETVEEAPAKQRLLPCLLFEEVGVFQRTQGALFVFSTFRVAKVKKVNG